MLVSAKGWRHEVNCAEEPDELKDLGMIEQLDGTPEG